MSGAYVRVDDHEVRKALDELKRAMGNLEPAFRDIGESLLRSHDERFRRQVDSTGKPWARLSARYAARKPKNKDKILVLDGYLSNLIYQTSPDSVAVGTDRIYGAIHQFGAQRGAFGKTRRGSPIPFGNIPARPFLGISDEDEREILDIIRDHLQSSF